MSEQTHHVAGEAVLVVVPGAELHEVAVESDTGLRVKDAGVGLADDVGRDDGLILVSHDFLQLAFAGGLHRGADFLVGGLLGERHGQVNDGAVRSGDTHGHAGQLALQLGDDLADGLRGAGGGGDDVVVGAAAETPVLLGVLVHDALRGGGGMNGGHEAFDDAEVVVQDLRHGGEAVGGAGSGGGDGEIGAVGLVVDAVNEHRGLVLRGGAHQHELRAGVQMGLHALGGEELAGALNHVRNVQLTPAEGGGIAAVEEQDGLAVNDQMMLVVGDGAFPLAVDGVMGENVGDLLRSLVRSVDGNDLHVAAAKSHAGRQTTDASESADTNSNHVCILL